MYILNLRFISLEFCNSESLKEFRSETNNMLPVKLLLVLVSACQSNIFVVLFVYKL